MVDTVRGVLRVRKWPEKRGTPKSALQRFWNDWFRQANRLAKYVDAASAIRAIELSKFSGFYPRDLLLKAMRGRLYTWRDETGWKWYSVAAVGDISESLDVLAQTVGSVLVRAVDRWRAPAPGNPGDVLTYQGPDDPVTWQGAAGAGGVPLVALAGTPVVPDNTKDTYEFIVTQFAYLNITLADIGFAAVDFPIMHLSLDNGSTWKTGLTAYYEQFFTSTNEVGKDITSFRLSRADPTTGHNAIAVLTNLQAGRAIFMADVGAGATLAGRRASRANFDGPITNIRIKSNNGSNFNAGVIYIVGALAS